MNDHEYLHQSHATSSRLHQAIESLQSGKKAASEYRELRRSVGRQKVVAPLLGISPQALRNRERGDVTITPEMILALERLGQSQPPEDKASPP